MAAEGKPHEASMFAAPLAWMTARALAAPRVTIALGLLLSLLCVVYAGLSLGFRTSRLDLLNPKSAWNQRWLAYLEEFGREDDAVVVVEGPDPASVVTAVDDLADELARHEEFFSSVFHRVELARLRAKGLHLVPAPKLAQLEAFVTQAEPVLRGDWQQLAVENQLQRMGFVLQRLPADAPQRGQMLEQLDRLTNGLEAALATTPTYRSPWPDAAALHDGYQDLDDKHLLADDGRLGMVLLKLVGSHGAPSDSDHHQSIVKLREIMQLVESRHPDVAIGATGMPILEHDEMHTSQRDMTWTSALSALGVAACFWAAFGGWRHAALAMAALGLSMCWAFGFVTATVGHLNLLSVSFASVLIGQGIDFGIHYVAGYLRTRRTIGDCREALQATSNSVGPGIFTGGLTTTVAFCMTLLTDFTGLRELGLIAGGGILICTLGALLLLPPMIRCADEKRPPQQMPQIVPMQFLTWPQHHLPRFTVAMILGFTVFCGIGLTRLRYDHNLLHLQSRGLDSVELEHTLIERADRSVWFALSMSGSAEELLQRKRKFASLASVSHTEEIVSLLPQDTPANTQSLANIRAVLALLPDESPQLNVAVPKAVAYAIGQLQRSLTNDAPRQQRLERVLSLLALRDEGETAQRLSIYQQEGSSELVARLAALRSFADPVAPEQSDLPRPLADRFIGKSGQYLLKVYAAGDVWDIDKLQRFVGDLESVDPRITGHPVQTYYASRQMQTSYVHAGIYAFIAMMIAVIVDLRRLRPSLLAVVPMFLGLVQTFGLLGWLGIPLNAANMIVLPLIFGIGIDDGVHLTHDYLHHRGKYRLDNATFVAVLLTSVTTMVGFGSLILAQHQGLRSLGQVLTLGVLCCLVSSTTLLPALFSAWSKDEPEETPSPAPPAAVEVAPVSLPQTQLRIDAPSRPAMAFAELQTPPKTVPRRVGQAD
jgi:hopanoid biosynthesis associated RND transporter like protein HpnN